MASTPRKSQRLWLAISCLASLVIQFLNTDSVEGTEFSGGWLTGPLLTMADMAVALFALALILAFWRLRIAAALALAASVLCLPLYLYFIAPVPFAQIFAAGHQFKVQPAGGVHLDTWPVGGVLTSAATVFVCFRGLATSNRARV